MEVKICKKYNECVLHKHKKKFSLIIILFLIVFKSPLLPFIGNFLVVEDKLKKTQMMIVFSGDGENNYHNLSFQKRVIDIKKIKNNYPNIKIVLTGRAAIFKESGNYKIFVN